jgi:hypothetical protein
MRRYTFTATVAVSVTVTADTEEAARRIAGGLPDPFTVLEVGKLSLCSVSEDDGLLDEDTP